MVKAAMEHLQLPQQRQGGGAVLRISAVRLEVL